MFYFTTAHRYTHLVGEGLCALPQTTKTWEYNDNTWSDLLTDYNGTPITYDEIGNPLTIGEKSLTWTGRQLQSITDNENAISYTYNGDGLRTSKTVNGTKTEYFYNGSILAGQKSGDDTLVFMYDNNSDIFGVIYNDVEYYYIKNAQNDVIGITDADGNILVKYFYDAWGKIISITKADDTDITDLEDDISQSIFDIATGESTPVLDENGNPVTSASESVILARINPILYRSYYYDKETEWYYLKTRYYSPDMCRFINGDGQINNDTLGNNLFSYCSNNPITREDKQGKGWWIPVATVVGALISTGGRIASNIATGKKWYSGCGGAFLGGAVAGFLTACGHPVAGAFAGAFIESAVNERISYSKYAKYNGSKRKKNTRKNRINSYIKIGRDTLVGGAVGVLTGKLSNKIVKVNPGWFKPEKLSTCLTGSYAQKTFAQLGSEECMNGVMDIVGNGLAIAFNDGQEPVLELYPTEYGEDNEP